MENVLKEKVIKFRNGIIPRREIISLLNGLIFKAIKVYKLKDKEIINEFYLFILSDFEKIIMKYDEPRFENFELWFLKVIKRRFLNFIKIEKRNAKFEFKNVDNIEIENIPYKKEDKINYSNIINNLNLSILSKKERKILELKLGQTNDQEIRETILNKIDKAQKIEDTLSFKYVKLLNLQSDIIKERDITKKQKLQDLEKIIKNSKRRVEKLLESLKLVPSDTVIAKRLGMSKSTVAVYYNRIKHKLLRTNNYKKIIEKIYN